ncbi:hypothetical protein HYS50_02755, partial [Candidatus Woesearchaeota archaeon]|nr:hypothetical protein [Candidatus Woesearchaeota archaeon]
MHYTHQAYYKNLSKISLSGQDFTKGLILPGYLSEDLAYVCGALAGDGNIHIRKHKHDYTLKCVGNPKDEILFYQTILIPLFQIVFNFKPRIGYKDQGTTFGFVVHSKALCTYLTKIIRLPKGKKHPFLRIPKIFLSSKKLRISFIRGLFDTDGCVSFKKMYRSYPYYPVISLNSKTKRLIKQTAGILKKLGFRSSETYDYKVKDKRNKKGYTIINRIDLCGNKNLNHWIKT